MRMYTNKLNLQP